MRSIMMMMKVMMMMMKLKLDNINMQNLLFLLVNNFCMLSKQLQYIHKWTLTGFELI
jgi:hypothetical protein